MANRKRPASELRGASRRDFIKYSVAVGALLGLDRSKVFEVVGGVGGNALADEAACAITNRSLHIVGGNAGFSWFQLLWPHADVWQNRQGGFALYNPGGGALATGTDRPLVLGLGAQTPWQSRDPARSISAFMAGKNEFTGAHIDNPTSTDTIDQGKGLFAACATLQAVNPTLVPVISVRTKDASMPYQAFPGAPAVAEVGSADGMLGLFDSAAASAQGPLSSPANAAYFEAYYKGFLGLSAAANRPNVGRAFRTGMTASKLVGVNLSGQISPTAQDLLRYGITLGTPTKLVEFAKTLIITAKAFRLGLTSCVLMPAFNDDPHQAFADQNALDATVLTMRTTMDAFMADLAVADPTCTGATLADNLVVTLHGDTPKTPLNLTAWPDATPGNTNWIYALGAGWLKTGWYGGIAADGSFSGFDASTGKSVPGQPSTMTAAPVAGAIAYAVAKGDMRRVFDFYRGPDFSGIVQPKIM
jgi:hypothetical protein